MPKKKQKSPGSQPKVDPALLQDEARKQHIQESTALILENASRPQKELLGAWMQEAIGIKKQEVFEGLEADIEEHERFMSHHSDLKLSIDWSLADAEEAISSGVQTLEAAREELQQLRNKRIEGIKCYFRERVLLLKEFFIQNIKTIEKTHKMFKRELTERIKLIEASEHAHLADTAQDFASELSLLKNRSIETEHQLKNILAGQRRALEGLLQTARLNYERESQQQSAAYKKLTLKDKELSLQTEQRTKEAAKMQAAINHCNAKAAQNKQDFEVRNSRIRAEIEQLRKHCKELRDEMEAARGLEKQRLIELSLCARDRKEELMRHLKLGDKILRMAALCRKYERKEASGEEPVSLPDDSTVSAWSPENKKLFKSLCDIMNNRGDESGVLGNFFKRLSKVSLEAACVKKSLGFVSRENKETKEAIKCIRNSFSVVAEGESCPPSSLLKVSRMRGAARENRR